MSKLSSEVQDVDRCDCFSRADGIGPTHGHHDEQCPLFPSEAAPDHIWLRQTHEQDGWQFGYYCDKPQDDAFVEYARVHQPPEQNLEDKNSVSGASDCSQTAVPKDNSLKAARHAFDSIGNGVDECECGLTQLAAIHLSDDVIDDRFVPFERPSTSDVFGSPDRGTRVRNEPESSSESSSTLVTVDESTKEERI